MSVANDKYTTRIGFYGKSPLPCDECGGYKEVINTEITFYCNGYIIDIDKKAECIVCFIKSSAGKDAKLEAYRMEGLL